MLFVLSSVSYCASAENLPKGLTHICEARIKEQKEADKYVSDPLVRADCRQRIQEAFERCFAPESTEALDKIQHGGGGAREAAQALTDAHRMGREQTTSRAILCKNERKAVIKQCEGDFHQIKSDLANNSSERMAKMEELNAQPFSAERDRASIEINQTAGERYSSLNKELSATGLALKHAEQQLANWAVCKANQARIHAHAEAEATTVLTAVSDGEATPPVGDLESNSEKPEDTNVGRYGKPLRGLATTMADKVANNAKGLPGTIATATMKAVKLNDKVATFTVPQEESISTLTGAAQSVAPYVLSPGNALRVSGVGTFIAASLSSDPVSKCSELYFDAVQAYNAGCHVYRPSSVSANEMAISTLSKP